MWVISIVQRHTEDRLDVVLHCLCDAGVSLGACIVKILVRFCLVE